MGRRVYVSNLAWRTSWQDLKDKCAHAGGRGLDSSRKRWQMRWHGSRSASAPGPAAGDAGGCRRSHRTHSFCCALSLLPAGSASAATLSTPT